MSFTPLRVRSHGSLLFGVASPEALLARAAELGYGALALTDRDNLYLAVRFLDAAPGVGLRALPGAELTAHDAPPPGWAARDGAVAPAPRRPPSVLLLPVDRRGWAQLCALITARMLDPSFDLVRAVGERHAGLHVIAESAGLVAALVAAGVPPALPAGETRARPLARRGGLWLGVRGLSFERPALRERLTAARRLGVHAVATGDVLLLQPHDHEAHRVAVTAAAGELLERMPGSAFGARDAWLASPAEWTRRVRATCAAAGCAGMADELLENNEALVERARPELEMGTPIFPRAPLASGESGAARLRALAEPGFARRYGAPAGGAVARAAAARRRERARARFETELALIEHMGFTDYFLLVGEIVGFARASGIPTVGRGSGASSIVSYALGVTNVDPIRYGLCFERFLHPQRRDCPDLDVDLCWQRRDEVIAHVYRTYGDDRVAMISTHATLGARSAFREAAKVLGLPLPRVNALARRVPRDLDASAVEQALAADVEARGARGGPPSPRGVAALLGDEFAQPRVAEALRLAAKLAGAPRHLSIHCGGLVIADRELTHYLPLERSAKGVVVSQFEMRAVERIGLVKMDLLGNRAITTIGECVDLVARFGERAAAGGNDAGAGDPESSPGESVRAGSRGCAESSPGDSPGAGWRDPDGASARPHQPAHAPSPAIDPEALPDDDAPAAATIRAGDTLNCFQLESPAMRHLVRMLCCDTLDATVAAVALVRPGPAESGMKEAFARRRRGLEPVAYPHPRLESTLADTYGTLLYEEDVMRVAAAFCGLPLAAGETLRRAIAGARSDEEFRFLERGFVAQAVRSGVTDAEALAVWRELTRFAAYAFCKAHAAGYGRLGWECAALKTRYPAAWAAGILNHHAGMYPTWVHVDDLRRGRRRDGVDAAAHDRAAASRGASGRDGATARAGAWLRPPVRFAAPCVQRSAWATTLEPDGTVRVGLQRVAGLAQATAERLLRARAGSPFSSLADVVERARPTPPELEALVLAGALDAVPEPARAGGPPTRPERLLEARVFAALGATSTRHGMNAREAPRLEAGDAAWLPPAAAPRPGGEALARLAEFGTADRVRGEFAATGLWFSAHPLDVLAPPEALAGTTSAAALHAHAGRRVRVAGLPCARRRVETKGGGAMAFVTLADHTGLVECVAFPDAYRRFAEALRGEIVRVEGRVDETLGALTVTVERAWAFAAGGFGDARAETAGQKGELGPSRYRVA